MVEAFADAVLNDTELPFSAEDSIHQMQTLDALKRAYQTNTAVDI